MRQKGKFESKEKTQKKRREELKGCFFISLVLVFGAVILELLGVADRPGSGRTAFLLGALALYLISCICSWVYKTIRKRKNEKHDSPEEEGTENTVADAERFEQDPPNQSKIEDY